MTSLKLICRVLIYFFLSLAALGAEGLKTALVRAEVAAVLAEPSPGSEQVTQALLGDPVHILTIKGKWAKVLVPQQYRTELGYPGWVKLADLELTLAQDAASEKVVVCYPSIALRLEPDISAPKLTTAYLATILPLDGTSRQQARAYTASEPWLKVLLPNNKRAWVREAHVRTAELSSALTVGWVIEKASSLLKTPYLWGGLSAKGVDCSGLTYLIYRSAGIILPRDADQQFEVGEEVRFEELQPGDLLFFGKGAEDITHVGVFAGEGTMIDATSSQGVGYVSVLSGWYKDNFQGARRIITGQQEPRLIPKSRE